MSECMIAAMQIKKYLDNTLYLSLSRKKHQLALTLIRVLAPWKERSEDCMEFLLCETSRGTLRFKEPIQLFDFISRKSEKTKINESPNNFFPYHSNPEPPFFGASYIARKMIERS